VYDGPNVDTVTMKKRIVHRHNTRSKMTARTNDNEKRQNQDDEEYIDDDDQEEEEDEEEEKDIDQDEDAPTKDDGWAYLMPIGLHVLEWLFEPATIVWSHSFWREHMEAILPYPPHPQYPHHLSDHLYHWSSSSSSYSAAHIHEVYNLWIDTVSMQLDAVLAPFHETLITVAEKIKRMNTNYQNRSASSYSRPPQMPSCPPVVRMAPRKRSSSFHAIGFTWLVAILQECWMVRTHGSCVFRYDMNYYRIHQYHAGHYVSLISSHEMLQSIDGPIDR
jgi:hypothetical protein